jgi:hypothetical protein
MENITRLGLWLQFSDDEIGVFQNYFIDYVKTYIETLDKIKIYQLAIFATETQYQMRILKSRILKQNKFKYEIDINNVWIDNILSYNNLIEFVVNKFIIEFNKMDLIKQYEYKKCNEYSYFNNTKTVNNKLKKDILKITNGK